MPFAPPGDPAEVNVYNIYMAKERPFVKGCRGLRIQDFARIGCPLDPSIWVQRVCGTRRKASDLSPRELQSSSTLRRPPGTANKEFPPAESASPNGLRSAKDPELEVPRDRARLHREGHDPLRAGPGLRLRPGPHSDDLKFVYEKGLAALPTMAVVLAYPGNWLESKESTADYTQGAARRAVPDAASAAAAGRHGGRPQAASSTCSTRARTRAPCSTPSAPSSTRRAASRSPP